MRHSGIAVKTRDGFSDILQVKGTLGIGPTFSREDGWGNPCTKTARLLLMEEVTEIPESRYEDLRASLAAVEPQVSWR